VAWSEGPGRIAAFWFCFVFEAGSCYAAQVGLKLRIQTRLSLLSAGITVKHYHTWNYGLLLELFPSHSQLRNCTNTVNVESDHSPVYLVKGSIISCLDNPNSWLLISFGPAVCYLLL
jgi:hypothetical protein